MSGHKLEFEMEAHTIHLHYNPILHDIALIIDQGVAKLHNYYRANIYHVYIKPLFLHCLTY